MALKANRLKRSAKKETRFKWWHILILVTLIGTLFFILESMKGRYSGDGSPVRPPLETQVKILPPASEYEQKPYTSARSIARQKPVKGRSAYLSGSVAVIVDDMGSSLAEVRELLSINIPLTFAIIPGLAKYKGVAEVANQAGQQVMVHIPMEPQGYPRQRLESNGLLVSQTEDEIVARTVDLVSSVPYAVGANNHMGSRFTEHEEKMIPVINVLRDKGLFFVDSRTSPRSAGYNVAERLGVKAASRNVFLDNQQDIAAIKKQLYAAAELSRKKGGVVAIGHPHAATIAALKEAMPELQKAGIKFVSAGDLVR